MKTRMLFLALILTIWSGCAFQEATRDLDFVTGANYVAPLNRYPGITPTRVMILPITGQVQNSYKQIFSNDFMSTLHQGRDFLVVPYSDKEMFRETLNLSREETFARARAQQCDAVLYVSLLNQQVYPPLRITAKVLMTDLQSGKIILDGSLDYDVQNELVANSARRYYQTYLQKTEAPDKSIVILNQNQLFLRYLGFDVAKAVLRAFSKDLS